MGFLSGAFALAISPADPNHLLLGTDSGLLRPWNAGLDWKAEAPDLVIGPAFAAAFDADGQRTLVSTASAIVRGDGQGWRTVRAPAPALLSGTGTWRIYPAGWSGLYRNDERCACWRDTLAPRGMSPSP
jgi:hypothetical protein